MPLVEWDVVVWQGPRCGAWIFCSLLLVERLISPPLVPSSGEDGKFHFCVERCWGTCMQRDKQL